MRLWRRKRAKLVSLGCVLILGTAAAALLLEDEGPYVPSGVLTPNEIDDIPRVIAHKTSGTDAPDNTLEAVRRLLATEIDAFELDVQLSADGVPFVYHEAELDGFTTGKGALSSRTADQVSKLRLVIDGRATEHPISPLEDVLDLVGTSKLLFLDVKDYGLRDTGMAAALAGLVRGYGLYRTVIVESFNPVFLRRMRQVDPRVRIMFDFADDTTPTTEESPGQLQQIPWLLKQEWFRHRVRRLVHPDLLGPRYSVRPEILRALADRGYPLVAWTVDDPDLALRLLESGAVAVMTNDPHGMRAHLAERIVRHVDDASRLNRTPVAGVVVVCSEEDVQRGLALARSSGRKVSIAGRRHSMGSQTLAPGNVVLDMTRFCGMRLDGESGVLTVQSGPPGPTCNAFSTRGGDPSS